MITQCAVLFAFLAMGELIVWATGIPVPSSIIGMLLLAAALRYRLVRPRHVEGVADFLVRNLGFFFVPAGVGVMRCMGIIRDQWLPIVGATVASTFVIIAVTGWAHQLTRRYLSRLNIHSHGVSAK
ncbi:MAG: CidA/LrgA family protein [Prevotellaceae bacterium]|nr:CidA/LrgA family protein [Prevotellaceae bacterium]MDO4932055.1 CidA/LrgA family protein [Prevotellaceae bacterium]